VIKYRETLRLHAQGISQRAIASSPSNSRTTIREVVKRADERNVSWPLEENTTDQVLQELLFSEKHTSTDLGWCLVQIQKKSNNKF